MNKFAAAALTFALAAVPSAVLADPNPPTYPKFIPGTNNQILWPSHDAACDKAMDEERYDDVLGDVSLEDNDPKTGLCMKAFAEYSAVITSLSHITGVSKHTILQVGVNTALTEVEIAWALHAEGDDDLGKAYAQGAVEIYETSVKSYQETLPKDILQSYATAFSRIAAMYPRLVPEEFQTQPGNPGEGDPEPDPQSTI